MLAVLAVQRRGVPSVMHSRQLNPYVDAALGDWRATSNVIAAVPRVSPQKYPQPAICTCTCGFCNPSPELVNR